MDSRIHSLHRPMPMPPQNKQAVNNKASFQDVFKEAQGIKVSKHAKSRLQERNIEISKDMWSKISQKMSEAKQKGVEDSLVVLDDATLVVSTKNQTVVTALDRGESQSQIFTNINGTIFINE